MSTRIPSNADRPLLAVVVFVCRLAVAAIFLMAAISKIIDLVGFESQLVQHSPLPGWAIPWVVRILPWLELTLAFCLLLGRAVREAAILSALLLAAFLVYTGFYATTGDCHCMVFPILKDEETPRSWVLTRDALALVAALVTAFVRLAKF
jgi:uncharacterized membrane protein YphA (DoxX/SURF4 family)